MRTARDCGGNVITHEGDNNPRLEKKKGAGRALSASMDGMKTAIRSKVFGGQDATRPQRQKAEFDHSVSSAHRKLFFRGSKPRVQR